MEHETPAQRVEWYRTLSTDQLVTYLHALELDLKAARTRPRRAQYTAEFCTERIDAINRILAERGVRVTKLT